MPRDHALLAGLSAEARLLLLAAGPRSSDDEISALVATGTIDWPALLALADRERATGVLWRRLRGNSLPELTDELRAAFERVAMIGQFTAGYLEQRLGETMAALNATGVDAVLLKGAALAVSAYGSFAERPMGDVDLAVSRGEAEGAFTTFQSAGWRWDSAAFPREKYRGHHHFPPLLDARGMDVRLELHTDLFVAGSPFTLSVAQLFGDGREVRIGKGRAIIPSPEHLLLHTCIHYTWSHMMLFGAWRAFRDVIALAGAGMDWDRFVAESERQKASSACFWTLRLAERLAGATLPGEVMRRLERSVSPSLLSIGERHAAREMFPSRDGCPSQWLRRRLWELSIRPRASGHGPVRPWELDDMAPENVNPDQREVGMVRAARHLPRLGEWARYARVLMR